MDTGLSSLHPWWGGGECWSPRAPAPSRLPAGLGGGDFPAAAPAGRPRTPACCALRAPVCWFAQPGPLLSRLLWAPLGRAGLRPGARTLGLPSEPPQPPPAPLWGGDPIRGRQKRSERRGLTQRVRCRPRCCGGGGQLAAGMFLAGQRSPGLARPPALSGATSWRNRPRMGMGVQGSLHLRENPRFLTVGRGPWGRGGQRQRLREGPSEGKLVAPPVPVACVRPRSPLGRTNRKLWRWPHRTPCRAGPTRDTGTSGARHPLLDKAQCQVECADPRQTEGSSTGPVRRGAPA